MQLTVSNDGKGPNMDLFVMAMVAIVCAILAALMAVFNKKRIGRVFAWAAIGLVAGLPLGYLIAPFIISFL